jgi:hypothetical protein
MIEYQFGEYTVFASTFERALQLFTEMLLMVKYDLRG